jgi:hypothetical protein
VADLFAARADPEVVVESPAHVAEGVSQPPVVITEQEVVFSTAAAISLPRMKPTGTVTAALRAMFLSSSEDARPAPSHYPPRRDAFPRGCQHSARNAQAVTASLNLLAPILVPHAAIGDVRGAHRWRRADNGEIQ